MVKSLLFYKLNNLFHFWPSVTSLPICVCPRDVCVKVFKGVKNSKVPQGFENWSWINRQKFHSNFVHQGKSILILHTGYNADAMVLWNVVVLLVLNFRLSSLVWILKFNLFRLLTNYLLHDNTEYFHVTELYTQIYYILHSRYFLAAKRSSTRALVLCLSVRLSVRGQNWISHCLVIL